MESVDWPLTCHSSRRLTTFAFRSSDVRRLLLDLDPYVSSVQITSFPLSHKQTNNRKHAKYKINQWPLSYQETIIGSETVNEAMRSPDNNVETINID